MQIYFAIGCNLSNAMGTGNELAVADFSIYSKIVPSFDIAHVQ